MAFIISSGIKWFTSLLATSHILVFQDTGVLEVMKGT